MVDAVQTDDTDLAGILAAEVASEVASEAEAPVSEETPAPEKEPAPPTDPIAELAAIKAKMAEYEAQLGQLATAPPQSVTQVQAELARLQQERAQEKAAAEAAQRDQRIRTLKALRVQAIEQQDVVAAERYADELDEAKRERDQAAILAKLQPVQPPPVHSQPAQQPENYGHLLEVQQWRIDNKVWDSAEFAATAAIDQLLRSNPASASKYRSNREIWDAALAQARGSKPADRPKPTYSPAVEGGGARTAVAKQQPRRTADEARAIQGLLRHGKGLTAKDFDE